MKAMIFAAGEGKRMRPLTHTVPKPLLEVQGKTLIEYRIAALKQAGISELVINVSYLGSQIMQALGDGRQLGVSIVYSVEEQPLETAGGLLKALPLLGDAPFLLMNADIWTDFDTTTLSSRQLNHNFAHLILVQNPRHHPSGDFSLDTDQVLIPARSLDESLTFAGISLISPELLKQYPAKKKQFGLREVFDYFMAKKCISGEFYAGKWADIGTPQRLAEIRRI